MYTYHLIKRRKEECDANLDPRPPDSLFTSKDKRILQCAREPTNFQSFSQNERGICRQVRKWAQDHPVNLLVGLTGAGALRTHLLSIRSIHTIAVTPSTRQAFGPLSGRALPFLNRQLFWDEGFCQPALVSQRDKWTYLAFESILPFFWKLIFWANFGGGTGGTGRWVGSSGGWLYVVWESDSRLVRWLRNSHPKVNRTKI